MTERKPAQSGFVRDTFRHAAIYSAASTMARIIGFIMLPLYAHVLRDDGYGVIGMVDASLTLLASLFGYALTDAVTRIYHEEKDPERQGSVVSTGAILAGVVAGGLGAATAVFSVPLSDILFGTKDYWYLLCMATAAFAVDTAGSTATAILTIRRRSTLFSLLALVRLLTGLTLNIVLIVGLRWGVTGYFVSQLVTAIVSAAIGFFVLSRAAPIRIDREHARSLIQYQLPLIPGAVASFFSRQVERIVVRFQLDLGAVGVLEMAYKFPVLINIFFVDPFMRSWATKRMEIADEPGAPERIGGMFVYFLYLTTFAYLLLFVNIERVLQIMTPPEFWAAAHIARVEATQMLVKAVALHMIFGLLYAKKTGLIARVMIVVSTLKVGLSYWFISHWGLMGAAYSGLVASTVQGAVMAWYARRYYRLEVDASRLVLVLGAGAAILFGVDRIPTEAIVNWGAPALEVVRSAGEGLSTTWIGTWQEGKVVTVLVDRVDYVFDVVIRTLLVCLYVLILPLVHVETRQKILSRVRFGPRT